MDARKIIVLAAAALTASAAANAARFQTVEEWSRCREVAESSVSQLEVGILGIEAEVRRRCGEVPPEEPSPIIGVVRMHPYDLVRSNAWRPRIAQLTGTRYQAFVDRFVMSDAMSLEGDWLVGEGFAAHLGGSDEAALAIHAKTGEVFGVMMEDGTKFIPFGFRALDDAPTYLRDWVNRRKP